MPECTPYVTDSQANRIFAECLNEPPMRAIYEGGKSMTLTATIMTFAAAASAVLAPADRQAIDRAVASYYRPYTIGRASAAVWERPIFARDIAALVAHWRRVMPADDLDGLNDGDWLCLCQDWDHSKFRVTTLERRALGPDTAEVRLRIDLGIGQTREARLLLRREARIWRIENLFAQDFPQGLQQALRETIAEDEKLRK